MPIEIDTTRLTVGCLVFTDFELLDVAGPLEMLGVPITQQKFQIILVSKQGGPVRSTQGVTVHADYSFADCPTPDILLVPGGQGSRVAVQDVTLLDWLRNVAVASPKPLTFLASVCTGSAILAKAGLLDGRKATTNKRAFSWVRSQSDKVNWIDDVRWVVDGHVITSAGVSAGMDMTLHLISRILGPAEAKEVAEFAEYRGQWTDPEAYPDFHARQNSSYWQAVPGKD